MEIARGERLTIIGPSGCGKTTFLRMIAGLEKPTQGALQIHSQKMSYVFQESRLITWKTVKDNLQFVRPDGHYKAMLDQVGLTGFENYYPAQLSGGMAQRINLARALIMEPDFLLLDEAFFSADIKIKYKIMQVINEYWDKQRITIISVTHDPKDALFLADRILLLSSRPSRITEEYMVDQSKDFVISNSNFQRAEAELVKKIMDN